MKITFKSIADSLFALILRSLPFGGFGDRIYHFLVFVMKHKRIPRKKNPLFNDILYEIKTSQEIKNPLRIFVSDKEFVKIFIKGILGEGYTIATYGVLSNAAEVDRFLFPPNCCIKPTHACGIVVFRKDGESLELGTLKSAFELNYYLKHRERNYESLTPKLIVEELIFGSTSPPEYKIFCYKGKAKVISVALQDCGKTQRAFLDMNWKMQPYGAIFPRPDEAPPKPHNLSEMVLSAESLARYFNFIRVDIFSDGVSHYVGELTNMNSGANAVFSPLGGEELITKLIFSE